MIALSVDQPTRAAWAWFELAQILEFLEQPKDDVRKACEQALKLEPLEPRFREWYEQKFGPRPKPTTPH